MEITDKIPETFSWLISSDAPFLTRRRQTKCKYVFRPLFLSRDAINCRASNNNSVCICYVVGCIYKLLWGHWFNHRISETKIKKYLVTIDPDGTVSILQYKLFWFFFYFAFFSCLHFIAFSLYVHTDMIISTSTNIHHMQIVQSAFYSSLASYSPLTLHSINWQRVERQGGSVFYRLRVSFFFFRFFVFLLQHILRLRPSLCEYSRLQCRLQTVQAQAHTCMFYAQNFFLWTGGRWIQISAWMHWLTIAYADMTYSDYISQLSFFSFFFILLYGWHRWIYMTLRQEMKKQKILWKNVYAFDVVVAAVMCFLFALKNII